MTFEEWAKTKGYNIEKLPCGAYRHDAESIAAEAYTAGQADAKALVEKMRAERIEVIMVFSIGIGFCCLGFSEYKALH